MKRETISQLYALMATLRNDRDGCFEPGYAGTTPNELSGRVSDLIRLLLEDAGEEYVED